MNKTVSVVMATYNGERYLREQMDSILQQTYPLHEIIIQDDGSTDSTVEILRDYEAKYSNVHVFVNPKNLGYKENFRTATLRATGDFIALSDQDDVWFPKKIEKQVGAIGDKAMCYTQHLAGYDMEYTRTVGYKNAPERQMFAAIVGHSMLMAKTFAQDSSNWLSYMAHDSGLAALAHYKGGVAYIEEPLNWHRILDSSVSHKGHLDTFKDKGHVPTWQPYVYGITNYRRLQKKEAWKRFYGRLLEESAEGRNPLVNKMCRLMLSNSVTALLRLCVLCMRHRDTIYPSNVAGIKGMVRGFCYPLIHSYHCDFYDA